MPGNTKQFRIQPKFETNFAIPMNIQSTCRIESQNNVTTWSVKAASNRPKISKSGLTFLKRDLASIIISFAQSFKLVDTPYSFKRYIYRLVILRCFCQYHQRLPHFLLWGGWGGNKSLYILITNDRNSLCT